MRESQESQQGNLKPLKKSLRALPYGRAWQSHWIASLLPAGRQVARNDTK